MEKKKKAALKIVPVLYAAGNSVVILNFAVWLPQKAAVQKKKRSQHLFQIYKLYRH